MRDAEKPSAGPLNLSETKLGTLRPPAVAPLWVTHLLKRMFDGQRWLAIRLISDASMLVLGTLIGGWISGMGEAAPELWLFPPLTLLLLNSRGRYRQGLGDVVLDSLAPGFGAVSIGAMSVFVLMALVDGTRSISSSLVMTTWLASVVAITAAGSVLTGLQYFVRKHRIIESPTLIVGADESGRNIAKRLAQHPEYGLLPVGFLESGDAETLPNVLPVLGNLDDLDSVAQGIAVGHLILAYPRTSTQALLALIRRCDELGIRTMVLPRLWGSINHQTQFEYLGTLPLLNLRAIDSDGWQIAIKYMLDRVVASLLLLLLAPPMLVIAICVKLSSPGPVLFRQLRAGRDCQPFELLKFRTMIVAPEGDCAFVPAKGVGPGGVEGPDRRTRVGRILRRTSLDELPQLLNVVRGEMSLVGPRPERPEFAEVFRQNFERYHDRHRVRSGITGWAQVNGYRGQTPLADRVAFDNFYIEHWSLGLDVKILLLTLPALLKGS